MSGGAWGLPSESIEKHGSTPPESIEKHGNAPPEDPATYGGGPDSTTAEPPGSGDRTPGAKKGVRGTREPAHYAGKERRVQRARDPEARRAALAVAVVEVVAEVGIGRTTHRAVAERAGLPLGATTYYFPTLDALIAAGLGRATADLRDELAAWGERLREAPEPATELALLVEEYLTDRKRTQIEYELYVAAARDEALRALARAWLDGIHELLAPHMDDAAARDVSALLDGVMIQSLVTGQNVDSKALAATIRRLAQPTTG